MSSICRGANCEMFGSIDGDNKLAAESIEAREQIIRWHATNPKAVFVCSVSGGKDGQAMYLMLRDMIPENRLIVVHANLGVVEHDGVLTHIKNHIDDVHELVVLKHESKDLLTMTLEKGMWPSPQYRNCTSTLKTSLIVNHPTFIGGKVI